MGVIIVGKIFISKILSKSTTIDMIRKSWQLDLNIIIREGGLNIYIIHFPSKDMAMEIVNNAPWNIMACLFNIVIWDNTKNINELTFSHVELWVQIHNMSMAMTIENARKLEGS